MFQFNSIQNNFNYPTKGNFAVVIIELNSTMLQSHSCTSLWKMYSAITGTIDVTQAVPL